MNLRESPPPSISLFGLTIHALNMDGTVRLLTQWLGETALDCRYVVTPNVDHVVKLDTDTAFRQSYQAASLVVADGRPVVLASKLLGKPLPGTVPGSDLVPALFEHHQTANKPLKVFLLGAAPGVAIRAAQAIESRWPTVSVVGTLSPPFGFEKDEPECQRICSEVAASKADLLVIGLGAPKQELWVARHASRLPVKVALCVGATIDFLAGEKPRAPMWMRKTGLEWLHRVGTEPRRLASRYAKDAVVFPRLFLKEWRSTRTGPAA